jgi:hypothetical protein
VNKELDELLDEVLASIPYPGENEEAVQAYLVRSELVDRVMEQVATLHHSRRALLWAGFLLLNLLLLCFLGTNRSFLLEYFGMRQELNGFLFLFLGLSLLGGVAGFILSLDTSWFHHFLERDA